jgi:Protein of unknown function (DUF3788)
MDIPNAFIGRTTQPAAKDIVSKLGASSKAWTQLIEWLQKQGIACNEWHSISPKYGWSLLAVLKKRRIVYLGPCDSCFRASFVLGDKAIAAARASDLPSSILKAIADARRYAEGTGVQLMVSTRKDLPAIRKLIEIKLEN